MKLAAVAIDYDGTIAVDGAFDPDVRSAIAQLRLHGIAVVLVTGRRLDDLKRVGATSDASVRSWRKTALCCLFLRAVATPSLAARPACN